MTELTTVQERELRHFVEHGDDAQPENEEESIACDALVTLGLLEFLGYDDSLQRDMYKPTPEGDAWVAEHPAK